ncbi:STAS domain-containing protein [Sulfurisoma sediminicola]|uniref:Phospholipid transport system transporter-binding protein n=1 Tax=Sulfurisoma sediminicola TaxID=1381557 RepID=A0A497XAZ1_9PROT|nr:STAS domain-containing protein [Sulfurisoma sediminicola]RLJ63736.1 phospholipid transport system transporter-binding protein [Sulfurisoma sediminicola]
MAISSAGDRIAVDGAMTLPMATNLLNEGNALIADGLDLVDLSAVTDVDSSGLAVVFGWLRAAKAQGKVIRVANPPEDFISLAEVYGVADQLPLA